MRISKVLPGPSWRTAIMVLLIASLLVPVIFASGFFFPYVVPRNLYFRAIIEVAGAIFVVALSFGRRRLDLRGEPILWALVAFLAAMFVSALVSPARMHSLFGDFERMGGVWAWLHLVLFFLLLRTLRDDDWAWILNGALAIGVFVGIKAIVEHAPVAASSSADSVAIPSMSTIGNAGLLGGYLLMCIGLAALLATRRGRFWPIYLAAGGITLLALFYADNRSSILGLALGSLFGGGIYAVVSTNSRKKWIGATMAIGFAVVITALTLTIKVFPGTGLARYVPGVVERLALSNLAGTDGSRAMQWRAAIEGFRDRPLVGYGIENHNLVWSEHFDPAIYGVDTDVFDRTHNQYLETLATTGAIGMLALLAIWIAISATLIRAFRVGRVSAPTAAVLWAIQLGYATYLVFWFFDLNSTMLWIAIAALIASRATIGPIVLEATSNDPHPASSKPMLALAAVACLVAAIYWEGVTPLAANRALANIDSGRAGLSEALASFDLLAHSSAHQTAHTPLEMAAYMGALRPALVAIRNDSSRREAMERAFGLSLGVFAREIQHDSLNDRLYAREAELLEEASQFYRSELYRQKAIEAYHKAIELNPGRIAQSIGLANLYMRSRDYERAVVVLNDAVKTDPTVGEVRFELAAAYMGAAKSDSALGMLQSSLRLGYVGTPETYLAMGKRLEFSGRSSAAAALYSDYLEAKYTEAVWDRSEIIDGPIPASDLAVAAHLPLVYMRARESELAVKSAAALSAFDPSRSLIVDRFVNDLGARRRSNWIARTSLLPCPTARGSSASDSTAFNACGVFRRKL